MTVRAFNKVTHEWTSTETGAELVPSQDWIINPTFSPDEVTAMMMGPNFWSYEGSVITTASLEVYNAAILELKRRNKWLEIQTERDRRKWGGVFVPTVSKWFHSDDSSRIQQIGLLLMGASLPPNLLWKTLDSTFVIMTPVLASTIFSLTAANDVALFAAAEQHRAQMLALADPSDYTFATGWPATFDD
jgi:hypothetical protein